MREHLLANSSPRSAVRLRLGLHGARSRPAVPVIGWLSSGNPQTDAPCHMERLMRKLVIGCAVLSTLSLCLSLMVVRLVAQEPARPPALKGDEELQSDAESSKGTDFRRGILGDPREAIILSKKQFLRIGPW